MPLADFQTQVANLVRDTDKVLVSADIVEAINAALARYSADQPRRVVVDVVSSGGQRIDLPAGFTDDSTLVGIEYPLDQIPAAQLSMIDVSIYAAPTVRQLELPMWTKVGEVLRVTYTAAHLLDDTDDTVPMRHRLAVASFAASVLCGQLASYYANEGEPSIAADSVDHQSKSQRWRLRQKDLSSEYVRIVGSAPPDRLVAASATVALSSRDALGGHRLFHPARNWPR